MQISSFRVWAFTGGFLLCLLTIQPTTAQIIPDTSLPQNSIVPPNCIDCEITGGTRVGNNLFHSFEQFSIPTGGVAYFNNAVTVENIISRVTGNSISNIDGLIRTNPAANLFLLNPYGIIFGPNASLDVGSSFIATTASKLAFADGTVFNTTTNGTTPLLTISRPIGLIFNQTPGRIVNQAASLDLNDNPIGLQIPAGRTLALVGGEVALEGGFLTTPGGRIELGSVSGNSVVSLTPIDKGWMLGYAGVQNFQDITLNQAAFIGSSDLMGADIKIQGRLVSLTEGSQISSLAGTGGQAGNLQINASEQLELVATPADFFITSLANEVEGEATGEGRILGITTKRLIIQNGAQVSTSTFGAGRGIDLNVTASELVELSGNASAFNLSSGVFAGSDVGSTGKGGTLTIETGRLILRDGAQVSTSTFGAGDAGDLRVIASDLVTVEGRTPDNVQASGLFAQVEDGSGDGGNLIIETQRLNVLRGAQISTSARSGGSGGNLTIDAGDFVLLSGFASTADDLSRSNILVSAERGATKNGGSLNITTGLLTVEKGARISADNFGSGQGGTATLNVRQLVVQDGGAIRAGSFGEGPGGTLTVYADDFVQVIGTGMIGSTLVPSTLFTQAEASGRAGNLNITTPRLNVGDGGRVTVNGVGSGAAGNLTITTNELRLNRGNLTAETNAKEGANISLQGLKLLFLQNQSLISAQAFNNANGGNINIDASNGFVIAVPKQNNDIIATAFIGRGGNINITANNIFGFEVGRARPGDTANNIDASSEFGFAGNVTINTPDIDPSRGLVNLPTSLVDASQAIASGCSANAKEGGDFIVTGRGGLPLSPHETLSSDIVWSDTRLTRIASQTNQRVALSTPKVQLHTSDVLANVPANDWVFNNKGEVTLLANASRDTPHHIGLISTSCSRY
ncbi:S-layer family protein [Nostoc sp. CHAB 5844]|nr:S-layer family protein [Nostoc sp. CHAB 5844]